LVERDVKGLEEPKDEQPENSSAAKLSEKISEKLSEKISEKISTQTLESKQTNALKQASNMKQTNLLK